MSVTTEACAGLVSGALRSAYADRRNVAKRMARKHGWAARTWKNWVSGANAPRMADLVLLMAECEALEAEVLALVQQVRDTP